MNWSKNLYFGNRMTEAENIIENNKIDFAEGEVTSLLLKPEESGDEILSGFSGALIPSKPSSFPWLNVKENVKSFNNNLTDDELDNLVSLVGLEGYEDHFPNNKSIGFRFRISFARALAINPKVILIDNPIHELALRRRLEIYSLIRNAASEKNVAIIFAVKSVSDSIRLSDKIIVRGGNNKELSLVKKIFIDEEERRNLKYQIDIQDYFSVSELNDIL